MMNRGEFLFPAVLFAAAAALIAGGMIAGYSWPVIAFPLAAAAIACALCAVQAVWAVAGEANPPPADAGEQLPPLTMESLAWVFALALFIYALGFVAGPAIYLLAYLRAHGSSWLLSGLVSAGSVVTTWGLFIKFLQVPLPLEPLWMG